MEYIHICIKQNQSKIRGVFPPRIRHFCEIPAATIKLRPGVNYKGSREQTHKNNTLNQEGLHLRVAHAHRRFAALILHIWISMSIKKRLIREMGMTGMIYLTLKLKNKGVVEICAVMLEMGTRKIAGLLLRTWRKG